MFAVDFPYIRVTLLTAKKLDHYYWTSTHTFIKSTSQEARAGSMELTAYDYNRRFFERVRALQVHQNRKKLCRFNNTSAASAWLGFLKRVKIPIIIGQSACLRMIFGQSVRLRNVSVHVEISRRSRELHLQTGKRTGTKERRMHARFNEHTLG